MGVADGIYAWKEQGIDAGLMSRALMERCKALVEADNEDVFQVQAVHDASLQGSSTVCLLAVDTTTGQLHSANLGDSGFLVFGPVDGPEEFELKFRTNQLEHSFGCPYQVGHQATANKVEDCDLASFHVHPGDVIVMGSDGLLDNVADLEILAEIKAMVHQGGSAYSLTQRLTKLAFDTSVNK
ncbi:protein phosphatase, partial [Haematococcus lacustris]